MKHVLMTGTKDVLMTGTKDVLMTGTEDVLMTGTKDVLMTGTKDVLMTGTSSAGRSPSRREKPWSSTKTSSPARMRLLHHADAACPISTR
jgi:hypothetical protein